MRLSFLSGLWRFKRFLPRGLFGRTLLIMVLPVLLTQALASFVFFDRHWRTVTGRMVEAAAGDVALAERLVTERLVSELEENNEARSPLPALLAVADIEISILPAAALPESSAPLFDPVQSLLAQALHTKLQKPFAIDQQVSLEQVVVFVALPEKLLAVAFPARRIYSPSTLIFILWMVGSALVLSLIAILFMRNQVRPIRRLAEAAEAFGKGQDVPGFKPEGAREVRQAAAELLGMRDRLRRSLAQRTTMLAGVSHDLRTPLTRMKLQLALWPESAEISGLQQDIAEMERMIEAYLAFARGEEAEPLQALDMERFLTDVAAPHLRHGAKIQMLIEENVWLVVRPLAFRRCVDNLLSNALRHGSRAVLILRAQGKQAEIWVEDDGVGIPVSQREEAFRPFVRLDAARASGEGSVGLGLTIARDIARQHGGDVLLQDATLGGLRAVVRMPL